VREEDRLLVGKPEENRQLGRRRSRPEDNIKTNLVGIGGGGVDSTVLTKDMDE
jgi:hypothetical protein